VLRDRDPAEIGDRSGLTRRQALLAGGAALAGPVLGAGCGRGSGGGRGPITLKFWNGFTGPDGKTMEKLVREFERENRDLRVAMQIIPWAQYYDKLTLGMAFKQGPDLFICPAARLPEYAQYRVFKDLSGFIAEDRGIDTSDFLPLAWEASQYEGRPVAVPLDCHPQGLYYNKRLFREAGLVDSAGEPLPPRTLDEFLATAKKLTIDKDGDGRPDQWGFAFTYQRSNWYTFALQRGASSLTPDLRKAMLDHPQALAATRQMRSFITEHRIAPNPEGIDAWMGFRQQRVAMALEGIYMLTSLEEMKDLDFGAAPVPLFGEQRATWAGSHLLCIPAYADEARARAAWRLIRFLSDHSMDWARGGQVPARLSLIRSPEFRTLKAQSAFAEQLPYIRYEPYSTKITEVGPFIDMAIESALLGLKPVEAAMKEGAGRVNRVLDRP
jgi:multiple sugar transport system substrate-binding protein